MSCAGGKLSLLIGGSGTPRMNLNTMKYTTHMILVLGLLATCSAAYGAETIRVVNAANTAVADRQGESSRGLLVTTKMVPNNVSSKHPLVFTVSGLKLDQKGVKNDSVELTFSVDGHGKNIYTSPPDRDGWLSANGMFLAKPDSKISITFKSMKVSLNGGKSEGVGSFDGFNSVRISGWGPVRNKQGEIIKNEKNINRVITDKMLLNDKEIAYLDHKEQRFLLHQESAITIERLDGVMRLAEYDFTFSAAGTSEELAAMQRVQPAQKTKREQGATLAQEATAPNPQVVLGIGSISVIMQGANE